MGLEIGGIVASTLKSHEEATALVERLFAVAQPSAVFGEPVTVGDHTVITASEVKIGMGSGYGAGGAAQAAVAEEETPHEAADGEVVEEGARPGFGVGGWGGGVSGSRPVAVISVGPEGVMVQPVVDVTKIALAFVTAVGAMAVMLGRMDRMGRELAGE